MLEAIKQSRALRWLLIWGGVLVALLLAIHFFSKKNPSAANAAANIPPTTYNINNKTVLVNGYPASVSPPPASVSPPPVRVPPPPASVPPPPAAPPPPASRPTRVRQITLTTPTSFNSLAAQYTGGQVAWLESWNRQLSSQPGYSKPWWTLPAGTTVNIPYK